MKTTTLLLIVILFTFFACNSQENKDIQKVNFTIYETVKKVQVPNRLIDTLKIASIKLENDSLSPIIGYVPKNEVVNNKLEFENVKLVKTIFTFKEKGEYCAVVAIKNNPVINISDIQKTKENNGNVEIHFNMTGAKKWSELTKNNIGNIVAFVINDEIYTLPYINGEIKNGVALINGINNEEQAKSIAEALNSSL